MPSMRFDIWDAPDTIDYNGRTYHRLLDLQDPSMFPPDVAPSQRGRYARYYGFPGGTNYDFAIPRPLGWGVADHQPRFWSGSRYTTQRNGIYWEPTEYVYRGAGTLQYMVPYEVTETLVVYPPAELVPGLDWEKGLDPFAYEPPSYSTVHEFGTIEADMHSPSNMYFGDGTGIVHDFIEIQNNWIAQDAERVYPGPARWYDLEPENPDTYRSVIQYANCDKHFYDSLVKFPITLGQDGNFVICQFNTYSHKSVQGDPAVDNYNGDQFWRPFVYAWAPEGADDVGGAIRAGAPSAGVAPALPKGT